MSTAIQTLHWLAGFIVLAEALNKLERTAPCAPGLSPRKRLVDWLKAIAWGALAVGGFGAVLSPLVYLSLDTQGLLDACVLTGFATLIIRTRFKEG